MLIHQGLTVYELLCLLCGLGSTPPHQDEFRKGGVDNRTPFHYGTHYSCAGYVVNYLIRLQPYSNMAIALQVSLVYLAVSLVYLAVSLMYLAVYS